MKTYVMGAGGIGLLLAYLLVKNGLDIELIARTHTKESLLRNKLKIEGAINDEVSVDCKLLEEISSFNAGDVIFITTKASDTKELLSDLDSKLAKGAIVVLCQNGIGVFEGAKLLVGEETSLLRLNCWMGAARTDANVVKLAGTFKFDLSGLDQNSLSRVAEILNITGIRVDVGDDPYLSEWQKALWNIAVNGLCSIVDQKNGVILDHDELKSIAEGLLKESKRVAALDGVNLKDEDLKQVFKSLETTRGNINATLQDLRAGKHPEIDYLNGAVVKRARKHDQNAPLNETIVNLVSYLEKVEARRK